MDIIKDGVTIKTYSATEIAIVESLVPAFQDWYDTGVVNLIASKNLSNEEIIKIVDNKVLSAIKKLGAANLAEAQVIISQPEYKSRATRDLEVTVI